MPSSATPKLDPKRALPILQSALKEDVGVRDWTASLLIHAKSTAEAEIVAQQPGVIAGLPLVEWAFGLLDKNIRVKPMIQEGESVQPGKAIVFLEGPARPILTGERTILNILSHLSGIATLTRGFVEHVKPFPVTILDTRKTLPNLRTLQKYAVAIGGGHNHRMGLYDQILIKENHLQVLVDSKKDPKINHVDVIEEALEKARRVNNRSVKIEIEVKNIAEFKKALECKVDLILLDNMPVDQLREAVKLKRATGRKIWLEASGGIRLENVQEIASTGVDYISIGALTHSAKALDLSLDIV